MYDTVAHKLVMTFTSSSMCEAMLSNYHPHPQALPQFGQNAEGTHERAAEKSAVNKGTSTSNDQGRTGHSKPTHTDHQNAL
jgi:hypothetical protein